MRSRNRPITARQRGFSLMEVMAASAVLSVLVLGMSSFWFSAAQRASDLVLRQQAIFVANAEMERISALYIWTDFAVDLLNGPLTTTGYTGAAGIPSTRFIYPADLGPLVPGPDKMITTVPATFLSGSEFVVWLNANALPTLDRSYVWINRARNIVGRLSWVTNDIIVASCINPGDCSCQQFNNTALPGGRCRTLDVYLEYPYRFDPAGTATAIGTPETISLRTIVGRG